MQKTKDHGFATQGRQSKLLPFQRRKGYNKKAHSKEEEKRSQPLFTLALSFTKEEFKRGREGRGRFIFLFQAHFLEVKLGFLGGSDPL